MSRGHTYVNLRFGSGHLTHFAGVVLLQQFIRQIQLRGFLAESLRFDWRNTHYPVSDLILSLVYPVVLGLGRIETSAYLSHNGVFQYLTGLTRYPAPTTLRRFLSRLGQPPALRVFEAMHDRMRRRFFAHPATRTSAVFDLDSTVFSVFGQQEGAVVGYNPRRVGRRSYQPLLCVERTGGGDAWAGSLRPGDRHVLRDAQPLIAHAIEKLPRGVRSVRVRADAAFYDGRFLSYLEGESVGYAIPARATRPLANRFGGLTYRAFKGNVEIAEMAYRAMGWERERRMIVVRRPIPEPPSWQLTLFKMGRHLYQVIVTNLDLEPLNLWRFYNERATMELAIRQWKYGWPLAKSPGRDWAMNAAWFHLVLFAFNLLKWFQRCAAPPELHRATIPTLRERLLCVPASLKRPQGKATLSLPAGYPYRDAFERTAQAIRRLKPMDFPATGVEPWISQWSAAEKETCHKSSQKR
jgi:hypothetical protein